MSSRAYTPPPPEKDIRVGDPDPPPNPAPVLAVSYGTPDADGLPRLLDHPITVEQRTCVTEACRLGISLVTCGPGIEAAANILSNDNSPLVQVAIKRVLSRLQLLVVLDYKLTLKRGEFGHHHRPPTTSYNPLGASTVYILPYLLDSLVIARADRANNYDDFARHLWWLALVIAHELVHILRLHVHYLLLGTVMIPYKTPPRILGTDGALSKDGEAGWDWDKALLGGLVRAGWVNDDAYRQQQPASTPAHIGEDVDRVAAVLGVRPDVSPSSDEVADVAQERFHRPFDYIIVEKQGKLYEFDDDWVRAQINAVAPEELGPFPARTYEDEMDPRQVILLRRGEAPPSDHHPAPQIRPVLLVLAASVRRRKGRHGP